MDKSIGSKAILVLEDGSSFTGKAIGKIGTTTGEICFNTGMTGYQEVFTDPSYFGQIIVTTSNHIGNYGVKNEEVESDDIRINGLVCKKFSQVYSRNLADSSLNDFFIDKNLVGIAEVDTREIVRSIRSKGAMNCIISSETMDVEELKGKLSQAPSMDGLELATKVSSTEAYFFGDPNASKKVAVLDLGVKKNILRLLADRGCDITVVPATTPAADVLAMKPDGVFLSNGPGDPEPCDYAIDSIREILGTPTPVFGICLGHQLLGLASGARTMKMKFGHHGANHPVQNLANGRVYITSQNHGFAIDEDELPDSLEVTHRSLFDQTIQGIRLKGHPAFSFQGHPEASPGPHDIIDLFDQFIELMEAA